MKSSQIGGQAVLEGIMMKNKDKCAVAVRKPDGEITTEVFEYKGILRWKQKDKIPLVRGVFAFVDSLILGMKALTFSAGFMLEDEPSGDAADAGDAGDSAVISADTGSKEKGTVPAKPPEKGTVPAKGMAKAKGTSKGMAKANGTSKGMTKDDVLLGIMMIAAVALALGLFMVVPYLISNIFRGVISSGFARTCLEALVRVAIFLLYILAVSRMKDIRRTFMYHGAEHKCINCIEHGMELTTPNVMKSSRQHKRCGTSFLFFVMFVSIIVCFFITTSSPVLRIVLRLALLPLIAGISYEIIRLAGNSENPVVELLSKPGLALQKMTTREPDEDMVEVAIRAVEEVFDWRTYLKENFAE